MEIKVGDVFMWREWGDCSVSGMFTIIKIDENRITYTYKDGVEMVTALSSLKRNLKRNSVIKLSPVLKELFDA